MRTQVGHWRGFPIIADRDLAPNVVRMEDSHTGKVLVIATDFNVDLKAELDAVILESITAPQQT